MATEIINESWDAISIKLTSYFNICSCQRKLKTIVDNLLSIRKKCLDADNLGTPRDFTGAEWLVLAILEQKHSSVTHGTNCEYPIIMENDPFWEWLDIVKNNPNLIDN